MYIYQIKNKINNKVYIGQTVKSLELRWKNHINKSKKTNTKLYNAMRKYGSNNFYIELVEECRNLDELSLKEEHYIKVLNTINTGYNMVDGGRTNVMDNDDIKKHHKMVMGSVEVRQKISFSMKEYRKRTPFTDVHRKRLSKSMLGNTSFKGMKRTPEAIEKTILALKKGVTCYDLQNNKIDSFNSVKDGALWWSKNGYDITTKKLCDMIKKSNDKDIYVKNLKWKYK